MVLTTEGFSEFGPPLVTPLLVLGRGCLGCECDGDTTASCFENRGCESRAGRIGIESWFLRRVRLSTANAGSGQQAEIVFDLAQCRIRAQVRMDETGVNRETDAVRRACERRGEGDPCAFVAGGEEGCVRLTSEQADCAPPSQCGTKISKWARQDNQAVQMAIALPDLRGQATRGNNDARVRLCFVERFSQRCCMHHGSEGALKLGQQVVLRQPAGGACKRPNQGFKIASGGECETSSNTHSCGNLCCEGGTYILYLPRSSSLRPSSHRRSSSELAPVLLPAERRAFSMTERLT